jgi:hypothetical protein
MKRRTFVFSPVALGLFSPFIRALEARANVLERDSYFITMHKAQHLYTNNNPAHFVPKMEGGRMVLPPDLIAFEGLQAFLTFVVGLDLKVNGGGDWHDCARSLFTGSANAGGRFGKPSNESIEAYVAAKIGLTSGPLAINPYHLADASTSDAYQPCWMRQASGAIVKVTPVADPLTLWNRLFAGFQPSGSTPTSPGSGAQNSVEAARFAARQSLFDSVRDDIQVLRDQVASEHRQQLQAHLDGFRELEKRVIGANGKPNPTMQDMNRVCAVPNQPSAAGAQVLNDLGLFKTLTGTLVDILLAGMRCNRTPRALSIQLGNGDDQRLIPGRWGTEFAHPSRGATGYHIEHSHLEPNDRGQPLQVNYAVKTQQVLMGYYARLLAGMATIPSGTGTVLSKSLAVFGTPMSYKHSCGMHSFLVAGNANARVPGNRVLSFGDPLQSTWESRAYPSERGHNDLLVSLLNAFGVTDVRTFGAPALNKGPLPGFVV